MGDLSTPLLVAAIGLAGVIVGTLMTQIGGWVTAGRNLRVQREIARDGAVRDYRKGRMLRVLDAIDQNAQALERVHILYQAWNIEAAKQVMESQKDWFVTQSVTNAQLASFVDASLLDVMIEYVNAENTYRHSWPHAFERALEKHTDPHAPIRITDAELIANYGRFVRALEAVHRTAERYMFDLDQVEDLRPWWRRLLR